PGVTSVCLGWAAGGSLGFGLSVKRRVVPLRDLAPEDLGKRRPVESELAELDARAGPRPARCRARRGKARRYKGCVTHGGDARRACARPPSPWPVARKGLSIGNHEPEGWLGRPPGLPAAAGGGRGWGGCGG